MQANCRKHVHTFLIGYRSGSTPCVFSSCGVCCNCGPSTREQCLPAPRQPPGSSCCLSLLAGGFRPTIDGRAGGGAGRRRRRPRGGARLGLTGLGQTWPSGYEIERGLALETARGTGKAPRVSARFYDGRSRACEWLGGSAAAALTGVARSRDSGLDSSSARAEGFWVRARFRHGEDRGWGRQPRGVSWAQGEATARHWGCGGAAELRGRGGAGCSAQRSTAGVKLLEDGGEADRWATGGRGGPRSRDGRAGLSCAEQRHGRHGGEEGPNLWGRGVS